MSAFTRMITQAPAGLMRALLLSLGAFAIPVFGAFLLPAGWGDYEALLWLTALIPAFLLAYHKGWKGVATSQAFGMAVLSVTYAITQMMGRSVPDLLFGVLAIYIALALMIGWHTERLHRASKRGVIEGEAFTDAGTGLPNRRHADLHLEIEFNAAQRGRSLAVVVLDLDHFRNYIARHGAIAGDEVLRRLGVALKDNSRRMGLCARYADDEFICILGGCDDDGALVYMARLQAALQASSAQLNLPTVCAGIASFRLNMGSAKDLVAAAYDALKRAKKDGPGRVRVHARPGPIAELPARAPVAAAAPPKPIMPEGRGLGRKALVVVDEASARALLARYLTDHGFAVAQVSNVVDGVQGLTIEYDLLVADISLSEGVGAELVRMAKLRWPLIQVLGLIQMTDGEALIDTLNSGVDRYIEKPLDLHKLRFHLTELLDRHDRMATPVTENRQLSLEFQAEKAEAANALRRNEEEYRSVVESLQEILFRLDADGVFAFLNWAWSATTSYPLDDSLGHPLLGFVHPEDRPRMEQTLQELISGKRKEARDEIRLVARDHSLRWVELRARPTYHKDGSVSGATGTLDDISSQKQAEERLRRTEAASRAILAALPDLVIGVSRTGVLLSFEGSNGAADAALGKTLDVTFPRHVATLLTQRLEQLFATGEVQVCEYSDEVDGTARQHEARLALIGTDEAVVIVRNVSDRRRLEEQLRQSQKLEAIGRLAGGLAHDFNNLLMVVQGNAQLIMEESAHDASARDFAQQIDTAAMRGADLIRQLLAFGRKQVLQPRVVNLNTVVRSVYALMPTLMGEDILIELNLDDELGSVKADPGQIEHVLMNLAAYAKLRLPLGGVLRITTRNALPGLHYDPQVINLDDGPLVSLAVEDSGAPLDQETRAQIFEPFFGDLTAPQGGLRLATVYGIVTQSGGTVLLDDAPSGGARFQIFLPRVDAD